MEPKLTDKQCDPCHGIGSALDASQIQALMPQLNRWTLAEGKRLEKSYKFADFMGPVRFLNLVAEVAEAEGHHPDLLIRWGEVKAMIWTHSVGGLTENDFILAAKIDSIFTQYIAG